MRHGRFSEEQIIGILKQNEAGAPVTQLCRDHGIGESTFYKWKSKYGGLEVSEAKRLRALEEENSKLKRLLADAMLDNAALKDVLSKMVRPAAKREVAAHLLGAHHFSQPQRSARGAAGLCSGLHATLQLALQKPSAR
jgi:putative transposase